MSGPPGAYVFDGFGPITPDPKISNLMRPTIGTSPHLLALALKTTRDAQIQDHLPSWRKNLKTKAGKTRQTLPRAVLAVERREDVADDPVRPALAPARAIELQGGRRCSLAPTGRPTRPRSTQR